jgi:membrane fusion protein (multidrug efflux system)
VRIALDPRELAANPLRVGLSVKTVVDTASKSGARLAAVAAAPYKGEVAGSDPQVEANIRQIIAANR